MTTKKLEWDETYSVGVNELDKQHQRMFNVINELLEAINTNTPQNHLGKIIEDLVKYKIFHFSTEEKYFKEFNYEETEEHIKKHREFNDRLAVIKSKHSEYNIEFAFELIDFLEDWLLTHLMTVDKRYTACFNQHGLK